MSAANVKTVTVKLTHSPESISQGPGPGIGAGVGDGGRDSGAGFAPGCGPSAMSGAGSSMLPLKTHTKTCVLLPGKVFLKEKESANTHQTKEYRDYVACVLTYPQSPGAGF